MNRRCCIHLLTCLQTDAVDDRVRMNREKLNRIR